MSTESQALTLDLDNLDELFLAPPANPFSTDAVDILGESGIDYLRKRYIRRWPKRRETHTLLIRLAPGTEWIEQDAAQLQQETRAAIGRYCSTHVQANREDRRLAMAVARRELLISFVVTLVALFMLALYSASEPSGFWGFVLALATLFAVYAAALATWDALESWFFDWTPYAVENRAYLWISSLEVRIAPRIE
jgi:hypothetical protein